MNFYISKNKDKMSLLNNRFLMNIVNFKYNKIQNKNDIDNIIQFFRRNNYEAVDCCGVITYSN